MAIMRRVTGAVREHQGALATATRTARALSVVGWIGGCITKMHYAQAADVDPQLHGGRAQKRALIDALRMRVMSSWVLASSRYQSARKRSSLSCRSSVPSWAVWSSARSRFVVEKSRRYISRKNVLGLGAWSL